MVEDKDSVVTLDTAAGSWVRQEAPEDQDDDWSGRAVSQYAAGPSLFVATHQYAQCIYTAHDQCVCLAAMPLFACEHHCFMSNVTYSSSTGWHRISDVCSRHTIMIGMPSVSFADTATTSAGNSIHFAAVLHFDCGIGVAASAWLLLHIFACTEVFIHLMLDIPCSYLQVSTCSGCRRLIHLHLWRAQGQHSAG